MPAEPARTTLLCCIVCTNIGLNNPTLQMGMSYGTVSNVFYVVLLGKKRSPCVGIEHGVELTEQQIRN